MKYILEKNVINDFGKEWETYNQSKLGFEEIKELFDHYFQIFPFDLIGKDSVGFDMGCGSGRWANLIAPKIKKLNCIEPSKKAIEEAKKNLKNYKNCYFENKSVFDNSLPSNSQDFGYCLGVLHHIYNTQSGLNECVKKLKKGAPLLIYLYYKFDNKPYWFRIIWQISDLLRQIISRMPFKLKLLITKLIAIIIYYPLAKFSYLIEKLGVNVQNIPISSYRHTSLYTMKTDALDRFGTKLEKRFSKNEILRMMEDCGLTNIKFSDKFPFWVAVGIKS